jgi:hypothetical protein
LDAYDLHAISYHDGLPHKGHVHVYFKSSDGEWYKAIGDEVQKVGLRSVHLSRTDKPVQSSLAKALEDPCGMHMNAGCYAAFYSQRGVSTEPAKMPEDLVDGVTADNYVFQEAFANAPEITRDWNLPPMPDLQIRAIRLEDQPPPYDENEEARDILMDPVTPAGYLVDTLTAPLQADLQTATQPVNAQSSPQPAPATELADESARDSTPVTSSGPPLPPRPTLTTPNLFATPEPDSQPTATNLALLNLRGGLGSEEDPMSAHTVHSQSGSKVTSGSTRSEGVPFVRAPELGVADEDMEKAFNVATSLGKVGGQPFWINPVCVLSGESGFEPGIRSCL